ncbi:hypothetical protein SGO26_30085 (plasmid) [Cupriavidus metallidurans]|uniref:hypothetical protein n=1 Tax=Cupriavidus metallidurans TaxID=119219 RepID=UPI003D72F9EE
MIKLAVGEQSPFPSANGATGIRAEFSEAGIALILQFPDVTAEDVAAVKATILAYSLRQTEANPIGSLTSIVDLADGVNIRFFSAPIFPSRAFLENWIVSESNALMYVLVDSNTNIIHSLRVAGLPDELLNIMKKAGRMITTAMSDFDMQTAAKDHWAVGDVERFNQGAKWVYSADEDVFVRRDSICLG